MLSIPSATPPDQEPDDASVAPPAIRLGYLPWELVHFSLPYRTPAETSWVRHNGDRWITFTAGPIQRADGTTEHVLPSGKYARAALLFLCTQAKLHNSPVVSIKTTYRSYLKDLGISWNTGSAREAARQLQALAACTITISTQADDHRLVTDRRFAFSSSSRIAFDHDNQGALDEKQESEIVLNDDLFASVLEHGNPINRVAWQLLAASSKSPLALDIYCWLSVRLFTMTKPVQRIRWVDLFEQFGSEGNIYKFKQNFRRALDQVLAVYPEANVTVVGEGERSGFRGLLLQTSPNALDSRIG